VADSVGGGTDLLAEFEINYGAQLIGCTVARVRGKITARPQVATTPANPFLIFGALVMNEEGAGVDVYPISEPHADWMFYEPCFVLNRDVSTAGDFSTSQVHCEVDIKSMRKIEELNQSLLLRAQSPDVGWDVSVSLSVLVLLP